ncbi:MAG: GGDEF domain-containing protein, partial [Candidatus Spyradocola sp.]
HRAVFQAETEKLYENIYEVDITHNRAASEATERYFESMGVPANTPYDQALPMIANRQVQEEFREGYLETFRRENVLRTYEEGGDSLCCEFKTLGQDGNYRWMRVTARIFHWEEDGSIRMFIYRQDIDEQKRQEASLLERMRRDSLSGLYNKDYTQKCIKQRLAEREGQRHAFFILDIDDFKHVNDTYGHAMGDKVIADFAARLKAQFGEEDIVGRIGGDEFVAFCAVASQEGADKAARALCAHLHYDFVSGTEVCPVSASIGVALAPEAGGNFEALYKNADIALYKTKARGKNGYALFDAEA